RLPIPNGAGTVQKKPARSRLNQAVHNAQHRINRIRTDALRQSSPANLRIPLGLEVASLQPPEAAVVPDLEFFFLADLAVRSHNIHIKSKGSAADRTNKSRIALFNERAKFGILGAQQNGRSTDLHRNVKQAARFQSWGCHHFKSATSPEIALPSPD